MPVILALWEAEAGGSLEAKHGETPSLLKIQKFSWAWWRAPVVPATQEAEAGESLEPRRWRLQSTEIAPLHSSLGNRARFCLKTNERTNKQQKTSEFLRVEFRPRPSCGSRTTPYGAVCGSHPGAKFRTPHPQGGRAFEGCVENPVMDSNPVMDYRVLGSQQEPARAGPQHC
uniref:Uncharacterized protein n=1 Tax=Macaca mulatta TaxID=9544 RepID=A0A5F8ABX4_MACMU